MAYKQLSPIIVSEGGTGAQTLTDHGVLLGSGTGAITPLAVAATGSTLMGVTGADPAFTGSPSFSGSVTAATTITATSGNFVLTAATTSSSVGSLNIGGNRFLHGFGALSDANTFVGNLAGNYTLTTAVAIQNTGIGHTSLDALTTGTLNTAIGAYAGSGINSGQQNTAVGNQALQLMTTSNQNTAIGHFSMRNATTPFQNTAIGASALSNLLTGQTNIVIGYNAASAYVGAETNNIITGASLAGTAGESNITRIGNGATAAHIAGTVIGSTGLTATTGNITATSGNLAITAATTSAVGQITQAGTAVFHTMGGVTNVWIGSGAGNFTLSGGFNTYVGSMNGAGTPVWTSGAQNTGMGWASFQKATTASYNTGVGIQALQNLVSGNYNAALGYLAGAADTTNDSNNIYINHGGVVGDNNVCRIGNGAGTGQQQLTKCFIHGIRGITTVNADAIAVLIDSAGQLGTVSSSIRFKEKVEDLGPESDRVYQLRPVSFHYKDNGRRATGLIAEEVEKVFPELVAYNADKEVETVKYHELPALLLNEIQKLNKRIIDLEKRFGV